MILIILYTYLINDVPIAGQAPGQYRLHLSALCPAGAGARHPGHGHRVGATRGHRGGASLSNSPGDMCTIVTSSKKLDWKVNITYMYITHNLVLTLGDLELTAIFLLTLFPPRL